jgi:hypothetical protein
LASPMRQQQHLHLCDNRSVAMAAEVGQFRTDLALPSLVRRPTTRGSIFGSVTCNAWRRRRFDVESRPPFAGGLGFHPGEVRLLQVASSIDGHKCVGSPASPLAGFGFHFKASLVVDTSRLQVGGWSWWAPVMVGECAALVLRLPRLVSCCGHYCWSVEPGSIGKRSCVVEVLLLFTDGDLRWLDL